MAGSILSQLLKKQITGTQALTSVNEWFSALLTHAATSSTSPSTSTGQVIVDDLKAAASAAVDLAETALGPIVDEAVTAIHEAATKMLTKAVGAPAAAQLSPIVDSGVDQLVALGIAAVQAAGVAAKAAIATPSQPSGV